MTTYPIYATSSEIKGNFINNDNDVIGQYILKEIKTGLLLTLMLNNLSEGWHAFHIHEKGLCELPDFKSAGGHFNPDGHQHGFVDHEQHHKGDLPNIYIHENGKAKLEIIIHEMKLSQLFDQDNSSFIIHEAMDDYQSQPSGNAGPRIACAVITE